MSDTHPDGKVLVVAMPVWRRPWLPIAAGIERCGHCGTPVWIVDSTPHERALCLDCFVAHKRPGPVTLTEEARARLRGMGMSDADIERAQEAFQRALSGPRWRG